VQSVILKADRTTAQTRRPHKMWLCGRRPWVVRLCWGTLGGDHTQCRPPDRIYYFVFLNVFLVFVGYASTSVLGHFGPKTDLHVHFGLRLLRSSVTSVFRTEVTEPDLSLAKSDRSSCR